jgi:sucrose-6-phosphate hydrolase SacC (GH32 family)
MAMARFLGLLSMLVLAALSGSSADAQTPGKGLIYRPASGQFWDPGVIYVAGKYYMYSMYGGDSVWLATSQDGVHWTDYGVVLKSEGFKNNRVWKPYVARVGDNFILNHGAFTGQGTNNNLLRFYESQDLIHWKHLYEIPIDTNFYRSNGRWDHMYTIPKNEQDPSQGFWGYMVADPIDHGGFGMMDSPDGVHFRPIKAPQILADFRIPTLEIGGIKKFGQKYYLLGGNVNHYGFSGYGVYTYVADSPTGPFRPDLDAYRLTGTSGIDGNYFIHVLACFVKDSPEDLVSDPFTFRNASDTDGQGTWFLPMRKAIVDAQGHLRLAYWRQNDLVKGKEIQVDTVENSVVFPPGQTAANPIVQVAGGGDRLLIHTDKDWKPFSWLDAGKTRKAITVLNHRFDLTKGLIIEGHINAKAVFHGYTDASKSYAGFFIEGLKKDELEKGSGTAILLEIGEPQWRESLIGRIQTEGSFRFEGIDATGRASATVTGLDDGKDHTFRLWLRSGQMELYIDDLLMQSFFYFKATGRIGFIAQESEVDFSKLRFYSMNL